MMDREPPLAWWIKHGIIGGLVAGVVFAVFEMLMAAWMTGWPAFLTPIRMIGATVLGQGALDPGYSPLLAGVTGAGVHLMFASMFGAIFGFVAWLFPLLWEHTGTTLMTASVYGIALWGVNFYAIAPWAGWAWFPARSTPFVEFLAHTFFFGSTLGLYLDSVIVRRSGRAQRPASEKVVEPMRKAG